MRVVFKPDLATFNIIINSFCKIDNMDHAVKNLDQKTKDNA